MTALTAAELRRRLRTRYGRTTPMVRIPEHLVLFEVPVDSFDPEQSDLAARARYRRRRIDAVAVGIWGGAGHLIHGFEIKASRADLLAELRQPGKGEAGWRRCDRWWLVVGDRSILRDDDPLPDGWGVLIPRGRGLGVLRESAVMPGERDGRFIAALLQSGLREHGACRGLGVVDGAVSEARRASRSYRQRTAS
jgi:hypothetical protein